MLNARPALSAALLLASAICYLLSMILERVGKDATIQSEHHF